MSDRILRDEIWESDRFLDLPTDIARLAFIRFLSLADDFGNFEGGPRRLFRILLACTQVKTEDAASHAIDVLMQADLIRRYEVEKRELFHVPRFRAHRQYLSRRVPKSPWCPNDDQLGKFKRIINQGLAKNIVTTTLLRSNDDATTTLLRSNDVAEGVGVGVGEDQKQDQLLSVGVSFFDSKRHEEKNTVLIDTKVAIGKRSNVRANKPEAVTSAVWESYALVYAQRWRTLPTRNAHVNGILARFVKRVPLDEAPEIAAFFVASPKALYVNAKHALNLLLRDAEPLRTEWLTRTHSTQTEALQGDQTAANGAMWHRLIEEARIDEDEKERIEREKTKLLGDSDGQK